MNKSKKLYTAMVDFRKAFDYINRDILWYKLLKSGIKGKIFNVIQDMYKSVKSRVKGFENDISDETFECLLGVK